MVDKNDVHSPLLSILKLKLVYNLNRDEISSSSDTILRKALRLANHSLTNILFFVQFLKWFYDYRENRSYGGDDFTTTNVTSDLGESSADFVPEPKLPDKLAQNKAYKALTTSQTGLCPLCNKKRSNPCALSVSGFVFCYPCIFRYVKENKQCPLTHFPCSTKSIVRIYSNNES